jgi:hypothetical protein
MVSGTEVLEISAARELASWKKRFNKMTRPAHYSRWKIEPIEFIRANELDAIRANIIKYIMRYDAKDGIKDLDKAQQYLTWLREDYLDGAPDLAVSTQTFRHEYTYPISTAHTHPIMTEAELIAAERALYEEGWTS